MLVEIRIGKEKKKNENKGWAVVCGADSSLVKIVRSEKEKEDQERPKE